MIRKCSCKHEYQDRIHGPGQRVHTVATKHDWTTCTVCGKTSPYNRHKKKEK